MDKKLFDAVVDQLGGTEELHDIARYGGGNGSSGFTYYSETCQFFENNRTAILDLVREMAADFGQSAMEFVKGFVCLKGVDEDEIGRALYGKTDETTVPNALAWFALEEAAHEFENR